jgi:predicted neuraminidase
VTSAAVLSTDGRLRPREDGLLEAYLPTRTVQAHAANLAVLPDGDLGCVWFGGTQEGVRDVQVWFSRRPLAGGYGVAWSEPEALSHDSTRSEQNPVLFTAPDGRLWLLWTAQLAGNQDTAVVRARTSDDAGRTWGPPRELLAKQGEGVFVRQPPVVLADGRWVLPTFACVSEAGRPWVGDVDTSSVWVSRDGGATWVEHPVPGSTGAVHMGVVPTDDGYAACYRSRWADFVHRSTSPDGVVWTPPEPTELPNNNSSVQAVRLAEGPIALVYNESSRLDAVARRTSLYDEVDDDGIVEGALPEVAEVSGGSQDHSADGRRRAFWGAPRAPLCLALSADDGRTWPARLVLADGDGYALSNNSRDGVNRELSYPSLVQAPDGALHVAFTHHRKAIRHLVVPATRLGALCAALP